MAGHVSKPDSFSAPSTPGPEELHRFDALLAKPVYEPPKIYRERSFMTMKLYALLATGLPLP